MPTKNVDTLALKAQVSWIRPSSKPMSSQNLRTRVDAFASQPCIFQHVVKRFNIAASHETIVSLIYFLYDYFRVRSTDFYVFSLFASQPSGGTQYHGAQAFV